MESSEITLKNVVIVVLLTTTLFLAAVDTSAIDGVVPLIQTHFGIKGGETAIIRTAQSAMHTATLAVMWIFGEVIERRTLYLISLTMWITISLLAIIAGSQIFLVFVALRSLAAAASAVLTVLSPVILADLFHGKALGVALVSMTAFELTSGATLAPIFSSFIVSSGLPWQAALAPGQVLALVPLVGLLCLMGKSKSGTIRLKKNVFAGAFRVLSIKSFTIIAIAASLGSFHVKALQFWMPSMILSAWKYAPEAFFGLSYPSATALHNILLLTGSVVGMPLVLWIAQSWHHSTGLFSGRAGNVNAYPILIALGAYINTGTFIVVMLMLDKSFAACLIPDFLAGIGASGDASLSKLMLLMVLPNGSRTAAMSLNFLIAGIVSTPSAQIIGFLSDVFRGDSTLEVDRFHAYQKAMLVSNLFMLGMAICCTVLVAFFKKDCRRADEETDKEERNDEENENSTLLGKEKGRSESVMDTLIRSRATTLELFQLQD